MTRALRFLEPLQRVLLKTLTTPALTPLFAPFMRNRATIFCLHRLHDVDRGTPGHDLQTLRAILARLRRERYALVGLEDLFRGLGEGDQRMSRAVAFTLDDGYVDQAELAGRVFGEFDCPATVFVVTGFLDGQLWLWWDRIEYILRHATRPMLEVELGGSVLRYTADEGGGYRSAQADFTERCKQVPDEEKEAAILRLVAAAEVDVPKRPPPDYAPMSWADLRACEQRGLTFGPHTVTHPVLSRTSDDRSHCEITQSWTRLAREARAPLPIFCYPGGQPWEYGPRERATVRELGAIGAVAGLQMHVTSRVFQRDPDARFEVPRFGYPADPRAVLQYASGLERVKRIVRPDRSVKTRIAWS
jgi:peptidoglycan/xylan/chitin deacetylase (PgdA/CDA1 family)